ncbi:MAG: hypothetical protein V3W34_18005 [Phycisphaerae bacterium]
MRLRRTAAGLLMAEKQFHRIRGCKLMPKLLAALDAQTTEVGNAPVAA